MIVLDTEAVQRAWPEVLHYGGVVVGDRIVVVAKRSAEASDRLVVVGDRIVVMDDHGAMRHDRM